MLLRYERKYLVPFKIMDALRARVLPFVDVDKYALISNPEFPQYTVRSIYLDTPNMDCHEEKTEGVELRKKFRIRSYNTYSPDAIAIFEIKRKMGSRIKKHRAFTSFQFVEPLMNSADIFKHIHQTGDCIDDAKRFFFHVKKNNLRSTVLVVYEREAYHGRIDSGVRITFDKNIRSLLNPAFSELYTNNNLRHLFPSHFILEIKYYTDEMPTWAKSLVQEFRLRNDALSKYTIGYDVNRKNHIFTY
jgi:SPX domain protein involved in polyphosphate accumulation